MDDWSSHFDDRPFESFEGTIQTNECDRRVLQAERTIVRSFRRFGRVGSRSLGAMARAWRGGQCCGAGGDRLGSLGVWVWCRGVRVCVR
jgi:hypothetical protein